ncbi:GFA family protein [Sphingomonas sp. SRS2]|uniref:GFA family protein n=1 Tax=Sphingomonas sp. SRS2 TaxID=133190 RepID=UPI00061849FD|nr:GFA family protein [Sphingomonas sp. SRS2]KKC24958.1 aldehyde-activating protein [Sphingomonas sp. SRS2]
MAFEGSCHCGKVAFAVEADPPAKAMQCNCSHCRRKGFLLAFFPVDQFTLLRGEDDLKSYLFYRHAIEHCFCTTCGTQPFAQGKTPGGGEIRAVNLRCVETIDPEALEIQKIDGASF